MPVDCTRSQQSLGTSPSGSSLGRSPDDPKPAIAHRLSGQVRAM
ncbi:hypothetical protein [Kamptonema formosum]|nr:hypothetical protein [Oscillatoria sp. PCC 10802]